MRPSLCRILVVLLLLLHQAAQAETVYRLRPIIRRGDSVGNSRIKAAGSFFVSGLNDRGQILFVADSATGGQMLSRFEEGHLTALVVPGGIAPGGQWSEGAPIRLPVSINQRGNVTFAAEVTGGGRQQVGAFFWEAAVRQVTPLLIPSRLTVPGLTLDPRGSLVPGLNNQDELVLTAAVTDPAKPSTGRAGVFLRSPGDQWLPVAVPDGVLPGGSKIAGAWNPSLNDAGQVVFLALPQGKELAVPYRWKQGAVTPLTPGVPVPPRGLFVLGFMGVWLNNANQNLLLAAYLHSLSTHALALYRHTGTTMVPIAVPGQEMPGGGKFQTLLDYGVSSANDRGEHAFLAQLQDGATAAYRMDAEGRLALVIKSGATTHLGKVISIGQGYGFLHGVGLNNTDQVALTLRFDRGPETLVLLTPAAP